MKKQLPTCHDCKFMDAGRFPRGNRGVAWFGRCHRYAPKAMEGEWPLVKATDWCGEWKRGPGRERDGKLCVEEDQVNDPAADVCSVQPLISSKLLLCRWCGQEKPYVEMRSSQQCGHCFCVRNGKDPNRWLNQSHHYLMTLSNQERNSQQKLKLDAVAQKSKIAVRDLTESYVAASLKLPIHLAKQFPEFIQSHREVIAMKREIDTKKKQQTKP